MMVELDTNNNSYDDTVPIAHVVPMGHVVVNVAQPVEDFNDYILQSPHHAQDLRNRERLVIAILMRKVAIKALCLGLLLLSLYAYFVFFF